MLKGQRWPWQNSIKDILTWGESFSADLESVTRCRGTRPAGSRQGIPPEDKKQVISSCGVKRPMDSVSTKVFLNCVLSSKNEMPSHPTSVGVFSPLSSLSSQSVSTIRAPLIWEKKIRFQEKLKNGMKLRKNGPWLKHSTFTCSG